MILSEFERDVAEIERRAVELASELNPAAVPLARVGRLYDQLDRAARALAAAKTLLAPRVAESRQWQRGGHRSAEDDLAARSGTSLAAAKNAVATGKALADNPTLRSAMARGELSPEQGTVIADAARSNPDATDKLIDTAKTGNLNQLRTEAGRAKAAADKDPDATYRRLHRQRRLSRYTDAEGSRHLHLQGPVDLVSVIEAELDRCLSHHIRNLSPKHPIESRDTMAFDAAVAMARRSARADRTSPDRPDGDPPTGAATPRASSPTPGAGVADTGNDSATPGTDTGSTPSRSGPTRPTSPAPDAGSGRLPDPGGPPGTAATPATGARGADANPTAGPSAAAGSATATAAANRAPASSEATTPDHSGTDPPGPVPRAQRRRARQAAPEHLALLRIDIEALWRGHVTGDEVCEIAGLGPFPISAAKRLLGDAVVKLVITRGDAVAHVTSLTRGPTQSMRYALLWTNPECTAQGCTCTILEADHRFGAEYKDTHRTRLDELDPLCHAHHALRTHKCWALVEGTGKRPIVGPTDPRHPKNLPRAGNDQAAPAAVSAGQRDLWSAAGTPARSP